MLWKGLRKDLTPGPIAYNVNEVIVSNIRSLVMSLNKFGVHDRETIRFKENIALVVSGDISSQKLEDATSLSRRVLLHGREMLPSLTVRQQSHR